MPVELRQVSSVILVGTCGRLILQQRDDVAGILHPGMIGLFGGHREEGETPLLCAQREVHEEIGHLLPFERFEPLLESRTVFEGTEELQNHVFVVRGIPSDALVVTEGQALFAPPGELAALYDRMTPSTSFAVRYLVTAGRIGAGPLPDKQQQPQQFPPPQAASQQQQ